MERKKLVAKKLLLLAKELLSAEGDKCGPKGCIIKTNKGWRIKSGITGKFWPQTYKTRETALKVLRRYHGWGFSK